MDALEQRIKEAYELHIQEKINEAESLYLGILEEYPSEAQTLALYGTLLLQTDRVDESILHLVKSIQLNPNIFIAHHNLGVCYSRSDVFPIALIYFNNSIKLNKAYYHTHREKGQVLAKLHRENEAIESYQEALKIYPDDDLAYINLCLLFYFGREYQKALSNNLKAIALNNKSSYYFQIQGLIYFELHEYEKGIESLRRSLSLDQENYKSYLGLLKIYIKLDDDLEIKKLKKDFLERFPDKEDIEVTLLLENIRDCNWQGIYQRKEELIKNSMSIVEPFVFSSLNDDPILIKNNTKKYIEHNFNLLNSRNFKAKLINQKIKIGYFSNDFIDHALTLLMKEIFRNHNHNDFYIIAFSYARPSKFDSETKDLISFFDQFININDKNDYEASLIAKEHHLDIAVDLTGLALGARPGILSYGVAPIQINFLGYPGTMGAPWIDYIVADRNIIPKKNEDFYDEKSIIMPHCYQPNKSIKPLKKSFTRKDFNLPEHGFIYCCFNDHYKIGPAIFDSWMEILHKVDKSILWLLEPNKNVMYYLREEAKKHGIDESPIIFSKKLLWEEHIERMSLADLFLDTYPYNAHTTASDSLRAEVPLLTLCGESFASRVASSLLNNLELDELITYDIETYKNKAILLAKNKELYRKTKNKLINNIYSREIFKPELFTKDLESAYKAAVQRFQAGLKPEHIYL